MRTAAVEIVGESSQWRLASRRGHYDGAVASESVVMLHGLGGTWRAFDGVIAALERERYTPLALDLPGHGAQTEAARPITYERCVELVLAKSPPRFALCGYSMGGRVALGVALAAPERVTRLVLVSASAGIEDENERTKRATADAKLAAEVEGAPLERFVRRWRDQPLFAGEPEEVRALAIADHRRNTTAGLAAALRGAGAGTMPPLWGRLPELRMPVLVLVGERDAKHREIGAKIATSVPDGSLRVVAGGHALLLENPAAVANAIEAPRSDPTTVLSYGN
jgi:2-succinyl-6-hydroxy-2,4-cyclohexadiene-1-carboxylate synthase